MICLNKFFVHHQVVHWLVKSYTQCSKKLEINIVYTMECIMYVTLLQWNTNVCDTFKTFLSRQIIHHQHLV